MQLATMQTRQQANKAEQKPHNGRWSIYLCFVLMSVLTLSPARASAQILRGIVHDSTGKPIPDVSLRFVRAGTSARTNVNGEFTLRGVATGVDTLLARLIGWRPLQIAFNLEGQSELNWSFVLERQPEMLDTVVATTRRECPMFSYTAFLCRSSSRLGYKRTAAQLAELRPRYWADLFDGLPGLRRISNGAGDFTIEPTTGWRCLVELIDGRPVGLSGRVSFTPDAVIGLEYYPSYAEVPEEYRRYAWEPLRLTPGNISSFTATCGVVVYWIKGVPLNDSVPPSR